MAADAPDLADDRAWFVRDAMFFVCCAALLGWGIWSESGITGKDEYWLSFRTVLEMQERGEWLTPYVNGAIRLEKPPLLYWLMRLSFVALGENLFAARVWCALFGALMALYTAKLMRHVARNAVVGGSGYVAGLIVVGAAGVAIDARRAMFDLPVGALCIAAVYAAVRWHARGRPLSAVAAGALLGAAAMTKGPVALWFFAAPLIAALLVRRGPARGPWWHWLPALAAFAATALPWPLWVQHAHPQFWDVMATQAENRSFGLPEPTRPLKLLGALLGLAVPWSLSVVGGAWWSLRRAGATVGPARWLCVWVVVGLLPFVFMGIFERYLLGLLPPMAILAATWITRQTAATQRLHLTLATALLSVPVVVFSAGAAWFGLSYLAPLLTLALLVLAWRIARREEPDVPLFAAMSAVLLAALIGVLYPSLGINRLPDDLPADLASTPVRTFGRAQPGMLSMRVAASVPQMSGEPAGLAARLAGYRGYLFVLDSDAERVEAAAKEAGAPLEHVTTFRSFYSRKTWLKFYKQGSTWPDWREALLTRDPDVLKPTFVCYRRP